MASAYIKPLIWGGEMCRGGRCLFAVFLVLAFWAIAAECRDLMVGDQMGWTSYDTRSFRVPDYVRWAATQHVRVGDQLVFKYPRGLHNVNLLPNKAAYESCDFSHANVLDTGSSGGYVWKATKEGVYYFGCNKRVEAEGNHCGSGQKFSIVVRPLSASLSTTLPSSTLSSSSWNEDFATVASAIAPTTSSSSTLSSSAPSMPPVMNTGASNRPSSIIATSITFLLVSLFISICNILL